MTCNIGTSSVVHVGVTQLYQSETSIALSSHAFTDHHGPGPALSPQMNIRIPGRAAANKPTFADAALPKISQPTCRVLGECRLRLGRGEVELTWLGRGFPCLETSTTTSSIRWMRYPHRTRGSLCRRFWQSDTNHGNVRVGGIPLLQSPTLRHPWPQKRLTKFVEYNS